MMAHMTKASACDRSVRTAPVRPGTSTGSGLAVKLPEWTYPVVFDTASGRVRYDNFNGRWGEQRRLDAFMQAYAIEKCRAEARRKGHTVTEQALPDGSVKLTVQVAGGTA